MVDFVLQYWLQVVFGGALSVLAVAYNRIQKKVQEQDAMRVAMQALLRDRIHQAYNHYKTIGCFPVHDRETIEMLFQSYKALGGNGTAHDLMKMIRELPTDEC